jgi:RNA polymerase sigma factor (sigma-70 family)
MQAISEDKFTGDINANIGIIHKICNVYFVGDHDRQDARQEILYQLWKSYPSYKGDAKFSTWMYKVALNTAIIYLKKRKRHQSNDLLTGQMEHIAESNEQAGPDEKMRILYTAINTLSEIDKAITLLYLENNSYEEISSITGITKSNVSVRLVRIRRALKEKLKNIISTF